MKTIVKTTVKRTNRVFIPIDDIAYIDTVSEKRIEHWMSLYSTCPEKCCCPIIKKLKHGEEIWRGSHEHLKGGTKYVIIDGRHRILARKRLGFDTVECHVIELIE